MANFNNKALNALFSAVINEEFKKISSIETTKKAWTILQTTYERTKAVKDSKFQRLTTRFEEIKMEENESFDDWDDTKIKAANFNNRALNAIFSAVINEEFKKISSIETTKEAWTILQTTYERTKAVKDSKFQRLTTSLEEIKMEEDEPFDEFYTKLKDIVNLAFNLA